MVTARQVSSALGLMGFGFALVAVLLQPLGVQASRAAAGIQNCGVSCPCDDERRARSRADERSEGDTGCTEQAPYNDDCADGCPDCGCCPATLAGVVPCVAPQVPGLDASYEPTGPRDAPSSGATSGVFRPPRPLS